MSKDFQLWKKQALSKLDKSNIGEIDEKIKFLCDKINSRNDMFTLSSCSGRICVIKGNKKNENIWLFRSHNLVNPNEIWELLGTQTTEELEFRQEGAIIHICCETMELARKLMHLGKESGFNQVGIIASQTKIVVELICDIVLFTPIYDEKLLLTKDYLEYLIEKSNENLKRNWENIEKLSEKIKNI